MDIRETTIIRDPIITVTATLSVVAAPERERLRCYAQGELKFAEYDNHGSSQFWQWAACYFGDAHPKLKSVTPQPMFPARFPRNQAELQRGLIAKFFGWNSRTKLEKSSPLARGE